MSTYGRIDAASLEIVWTQLVAVADEAFPVKLYYSFSFLLLVLDLFEDFSIHR